MYLLVCWWDGFIIIENLECDPKTFTISKQMAGVLPKGVSPFSRLIGMQSS
jgi:hypothetical protein